MRADEALAKGAAIGDASLHHEIEQLLYAEAVLLDQGRLDEWLALYTEDATYWVPLTSTQPDPYTGVSLIFDDHALLEVRVRQFKHPRALARAPMPRTVHTVGNIRLLGDDGRDLAVASTLLMVEYRQSRQRAWAGLVEHRLRRVDGTLRIAGKRIDLVDSESELGGIVSLF
jgi:3-phenylpropionate/cinnamic acid dioxygenase small subunit